MSLPVVSEIVGDIQRGNNVIRKEQDKVCLNVPLELCLKCGNGEIDNAFEECDDGNNIDEDGCSRSCENE